MALAALLGLGSCGDASDNSTTPSAATPGASDASDRAETSAAPGTTDGATVALAAPDLLARRALPVGGLPLGLLAGEFDGDGLADLAVVTETPGELLLLAGSPTGLGLPTRLAIGAYPTDLIRVSFRKLVVASRATGELLEVEVERSGDSLHGRITRRFTPALDGARIEVLASADLGRDGTPEVLVATTDDQLLVLDWPAMDEAGELQPSERLRLALEPGARPVGLLAPSDGSGVAVLCQGDASVRLVGPAADGQLAQLARIEFEGIPRSACEADLDGDGDLEQVFVGGDRNLLVFGLESPLAAPEAGGFCASPGTGRAFEQHGLVPLGFTHSDLDRDGREELIGLAHNDQGYSVLGGFEAAAVPPGSTSGLPRPAIMISEYAGQDPWDLDLGDFDGDGRLDLAVACRSAGALSILQGTGLAKAEKAAFHQARRTAVGANPLSIASLDVNGDGRPEVATLDAADGQLSLLVNDGYGTLTLATRLPIGASPRGLLAADFAGEAGSGAQLIALTAPDGVNGRLVALGRAPGADGSPGDFGLVDVVVDGNALPAAGEAGLATADLDGDGKSDLVLIGGGRLHVLLGRGFRDGSLCFEARAELALPAVAQAVCVLRRPSGPLIAVAIGTRVHLIDPATGTEAATALEPLLELGGRAETRGCGRLAAGDLDGDGWDDLAGLWLGPQGTSPGRLTLQTLATDHHARITFDLPTGFAPADMLVADLNGDGLGDALVAAQNSHLVQLWVNRGSAGMQPAPDLGVGLGPFDLAVADLLGKGLVDILVANAFSADVSTIFNRRRP